MIDHTPVLLEGHDQNDLMLIERSFSKARIIHPISCIENGEQAIAGPEGAGAFANRCRHPLPFRLLDFTLPKLSGHEVLEWLRQQPLLKRLPVVFGKFATLTRQLQIYGLMLSGHPDIVLGRAGTSRTIFI